MSLHTPLQPSSQNPPTARLEAPFPLDPLERIVPLALKLSGTLISAWLLYVVAEYASTFPPYSTSLLFQLVYSWIILPLHEGGHFISLPFGRTLYILGGSFWQVAFPLLLFGVTVRRRTVWSAYYLTFAAVSAISVTPYIYDAPYRTLPLLGGKHVGHDWWNLLNHWQMLDSAEAIADAVYATGLGVGIVGLGGAILIAVTDYIASGRRTPSAFVPPTMRGQTSTEFDGRESSKQLDDRQQENDPG